MSSDDFGPMTSGLESPEDHAKLLHAQLEAVQKREQQLLRERRDSETEFGQKRALFMDLYKQKEGELNVNEKVLEDTKKENARLQADLDRLRVELDDLKTATVISEATKQEEVEHMRRKCQEEIASLQHIMKEAVCQAQEEAQATLKDVHSSHESEGFLTSVAKSLQKRVAGAASAAHDNLEESMKKAQEDAEILKSVVMPLEEEIKMLKSKLRDTRDQCEQLDNKLRVYTGADADKISTTSESASIADDKVRELNHHLETEKASRTDLEMYVAVLNTQKTVLQEDADKLRTQLQEVCKMMEVEKFEHNALKETWQMANDQFLESQRLMMMDMRNMESLLSSEQQMQFGELKKKDALREAQEKRVQELEQHRKMEEEKLKQATAAKHKEGSDMKEINDTLLRHSSSKTSLLSNNSEDLLRFAEADSLLKRSSSGSALSDPLDGSMNDTRSLDGSFLRLSPEKHLAIPALTTEMQRALSDPTPETEASKTLVASAKSRSDTLPTTGRRMVSEKEWKALQDELKASREKLGRPCDMCSNYEAQLQASHQQQRKTEAQLRTIDRQLELERQAISTTQQYVKELEENLEKTATQAEKEISQLVTKVEDADKHVISLRQQFLQIQTELQEQLMTLTKGREELQKELNKIQEENDSLMGKYSLHSQQMQEENINLPNNVEELQLLLLQYREEVITAKVGREHIEDTLKSEMMFLKDQVVAEQQERGNTEETLNNEISNLQEQLAVLQSAKSEMERQSQLRTEAEKKLLETEQSLKNIQAKSKQLITALQTQLEEQSNSRISLEDQVSSLKIKVSSLQVDLDNSEAVQRDFVKLSQSLQIQLEKIRSAEHEVRWTHDEDTDDCSQCRQNFSVTKRKHHCRHCGKIFCTDCLSKTVNSGPNLRPSKVCDVCHTILVQDATPYFSSEPPSTPD